MIQKSKTIVTIERVVTVSKSGSRLVRKFMFLLYSIIQNVCLNKKGNGDMMISLNTGRNCSHSLREIYDRAQYPLLAARETLQLFGVSDLIFGSGMYGSLRRHCLLKLSQHNE
jgi:hypothetical protein